ncbi:unnamed protein product [Pleuronectes platessa]|uniref:Uncharacterized protein n=1 Tax=Pleuronectes platessa TaxID=8262 RepID=A0A9N7UG04_PLEPL|nr:unnamed protein product [Pleuronectes platessa]
MKVATRQRIQRADRQVTRNVRVKSTLYTALQCKAFTESIHYVAVMERDGGRRAMQQRSPERRRVARGSPDLRVTAGCIFKMYPPYKRTLSAIIDITSHRG